MGREGLDVSLFRAVVALSPQNKITLRVGGGAGGRGWMLFYFGRLSALNPQSKIPLGVGEVGVDGAGRYLISWAVVGPKSPKIT